MDFYNWYNGLSQQDRDLLGDDAAQAAKLGSLGWSVKGDSSIRQTIWDYAKNQYGDDYLGMQGYLTGVGGFTYNPEWESWLNNMIAVQNQNSEHDWSEMMRDTNISADASQLASLGLNPASVISMNRSQTPIMDAAGVDRSDNANARQAREFQRRENITNRMFSLLSGMSAAGLGIAALKGPKFIAARMANSTARAAKRAFSTGKIAEPVVNPLRKPAVVSSKIYYTDSDTWN